MQNSAIACIEEACHEENHRYCVLTQYLVEQEAFRSGDYEHALQEAFAKEARLYQQENITGARTNVSLCLIDFAKGSITIADEGDSHIVIAQQHDQLGGMYGVVS
jgi:hypothetical protein